MLTIRGVYDHDNELWGFRIDDILKLLRLAPNLGQFLFPFRRTVGAVHAIEKLVLPKLKRLMFGQPGTCPGFGDRLINGLTPRP